jgi:hypothetical protein
MSVSAQFNETFYLTNNADVVVAISQGTFSSALQHFNLFGGRELRAPNSTFDANYYAINNADVLNAVSAGTFANVFAHFQAFGEIENRAPTSAFATFDAAGYLAANADVAAAVLAGTFSSALDHFISFGQTESRAGSGVTAAINPGTTFTLTTSGEALTGTDNDDTFIAGVSATAADNTLGLVDSLNGGAGTDTLTVSAQVLAANIAVPSTGLSNIETVKITAVDGDGIVGTDAATFASRSDVTTVKAAGNSNVTVTALAAGSTIEMVGDGNTVNGILSYAYGTASGAQNITVSGGTVSSGTNNITATASGGVTTATINSTGAANNVDTILLDSATGGTVTSLTVNATTNFTATLTAGDYAATSTATITGAGAVNIGTAANFQTIDASANTGGVTVAIGTATSSLTGSTGNDVITSAATTSTTAGIIDAGDGSDTLIVANVNQVDTAAEGAEYTNFETLRMGGTLDVSHVGSAMTALQLTGTSTLTNVTAALAADTTVRADAGATGIALASAAGTSDVLTMKMGTGAADASEATDFTGTLTVNGFETINIQTNQGTTATTDALKTSEFTALAADSVTAINLTGHAVTITNAATTKATTIDGSALTGILTIGGDLIAGSTVTGGAGKDVFTAGANNGSTYNGGASDDKLTATVAQMRATGSADTVFAGGAGTKDNLTISTAAATLTDNHFTNVTGVEQLTTAGTGNTSVTVGGSFKAGFADGVTVATGALVDTVVYTFDGGLYDKDTTITVSAGLSVGNGAAEDITVTTGSGSDTITIETDDTFVGQAGDTGTIAVVANAGDDTIVFDYGNLLVTTNSQIATIDAGTGADTITKGSNADNSTSATAATIYTINAGDSLATAAGHDIINGFEFADGINQSDVLQFDGTAAVGTLGTSTDSGTILSHSISAGIASFDDAAVHATALVISDTNLADVVSYLNSNSNNNGVVGFLFDSSGNGANDGTMIYHNAAGSGVNSLVQLNGVTTLDAIVVAAGVGANDLVAL